MPKPYDVAPILGLEPQVGLLLQMLDATTDEWREELGEIPEAAILWQPVPGAHSIGALILHIIDVEAYWLTEIAGGIPRSQEEKDRLLSDATDQYAGIWPTPSPQPLTWYWEQFAAVRARTHAMVRGLNNPAHIGHRVGRKGEQDFTLRWLLHHVIIHEAYHGGQAVLLALQYAAQHP